MPTLLERPSSAMAILTLTLTLCLATPTLSSKPLLKCDCDPRYCSEPTCATDGVCFASAKRSVPNGPVDVVRRCVDSAYLIPPQRPFVCEYNRRQNHTYVSGCCKDGDMCNKHMNLTLSPNWPESNSGHPFRGPFGERNRNDGNDMHTTDSPDSQAWTWERVLVVVVLGGGSAISAVLLASLLFRKRQQRHKQHRLPPEQHQHSHEQQQQQHQSPCRDCCGLLSSYNEVNSCDTTQQQRPGVHHPHPNLTSPAPPQTLGTSSSLSTRASSSGYGSSGGRGSNTSPRTTQVVARNGQPPTQAGENISTSLQEYLNNLSSGSGSGLPLLYQRTVARQITLVEPIGQGRFGKVWKGLWRDDPVAIKIFSSVDERSWAREVEIYQTVMLRHPNVLGFIAADNKDTGMCTQLWLVMEYVSSGSLFDYLSVHTVSTEMLLQMCLSIASGLAHLHMEIEGTHGKPAIAHRDLKSKNILVKQGGICAIGDFGLAVRFKPDSNSIDMPENGKVGTNRYMSPELLKADHSGEDGVVVTTNFFNPAGEFNKFKQCDVYSMGLVFWEIISRCYGEGDLSVSDYSPPYFDAVGAEPTLEEMRRVVCFERRRPTLPAAISSQFLCGVSNLTSECWFESASARPSAYRAKRTLAELKRLYLQSESSDDDDKKLVQVRIV